MKKYSKNFERDYKFYLDWYDSSASGFIGKSTAELLSRVNKYPSENLSAKEAFFLLDSSNIDNVSVLDVELKELIAVLSGKCSINLHIKIWSENLSLGLLTINELKENMPNLPSWVLTACTNQSIKLINNRKSTL